MVCLRLWLTMCTSYGYNLPILYLNNAPCNKTEIPSNWFHEDDGEFFSGLCHSLGLINECINKREGYKKKVVFIS